MKRRSFLSVLGMAPAVAVVATLPARVAPVIEAPAAIASTSELDLLATLSAKGVPVPLRMWMAAAKISHEALVRDFEADVALRRALS